jgi:hypothetical protein
MNKLDCATIILIVVLFILIMTIIVRKIRQHFIRKQCNYLCYSCKYKYECNVFKGV